MPAHAQRTRHKRNKTHAPRTRVAQGKCGDHRRGGCVRGSTLVPEYAQSFQKGQLPDDRRDGFQFRKLIVAQVENLKQLELLEVRIVERFEAVPYQNELAQVLEFAHIDKTEFRVAEVEDGEEVVRDERIRLSEEKHVQYYRIAQLLCAGFRVFRLIPAFPRLRALSERDGRVECVQNWRKHALETQEAQQLHSVVCVAHARVLAQARDFQIGNRVQERGDACLRHVDIVVRYAEYAQVAMVLKAHPLEVRDLVVRKVELNQVYKTGEVTSA